MTKYSTLILTAAVASTFALAALMAEDDDGRFEQWPIAGQNLSNTRSQTNKNGIERENVQALRMRWVFTTGGDVSATPTVAGDAVYVPDWAGNLFAIRKKDGTLIWSKKISDYDGFSGALARVSPAVHGDELILGDIQSERVVHNGANVIAVDRHTGVLRWITQVDNHPAAIITGSPVFLGDVVYVGVSSTEEALATDPNYPCCSFRGSMVALNANNGQILWKIFAVPDNGGQPGGYSGGAILSPPAIDPSRGSLYIGTGNNYTVPPAVEACQAEAITGNNLQANCTSPDDHFDTALALDLQSGHIKLAKRLSGYDVFTLVCLAPRPGVTCPSPAGPDFDLPGSGPNLLPNIVGFGQKSGIYWALNPASGDIVWSTLVGPGGVSGGVQWGTATDDRRIYVAIGNSLHKPFTLTPSGQTIDWGSWSALDAATGKILWQTPDPTSGTVDPGAVSTANGVLYAGSYSGNMYALNARTGRILWSFASGGSVIDAPSIVNGVLYWGSGYGRIPPGTPNNKLFAFSLPED